MGICQSQTKHKKLASTTILNKKSKLQEGDEWKKERKKLSAEIRRLRNKLLETTTHGRCCCCVGRDMAVHKWKHLYFAIKLELDHLIHRTHQEGTVLCWKPDDAAAIAELQEEAKAKDEQIQLLQEQLATVKLQEYKREGEMDILRQSLRIISHNNNYNRHIASLACRTKPSIQECSYEQL